MQSLNDRITLGIYSLEARDDCSFRQVTFPHTILASYRIIYVQYALMRHTILVCASP